MKFCKTNSTKMTSTLEMRLQQAAIDPAQEDFNKPQRVDQLETTKSRYPYQSVDALQLHWANCAHGESCKVAGMELLRIFREDMGFQSCDSFSIPDVKPFNALEKKLYEFKSQRSASGTILGVRYVGHGNLDNNLRMRWAGWRYEA